MQHGTNFQKLEASVARNEREQNPGSVFEPLDHSTFHTGYMPHPPLQGEGRLPKLAQRA